MLLFVYFLEERSHCITRMSCTLYVNWASLELATVFLPVLGILELQVVLYGPLTITTVCACLCDSLASPCFLSSRLQAYGRGYALFCLITWVDA